MNVEISDDFIRVKVLLFIDNFDRTLLKFYILFV